MVRDVGGHYGRGPEKALAVKAGKDLAGVGEVDGDVEAEEVGGVARFGEEVPGDFEGDAADEDEVVAFVELGY